MSGLSERRNLLFAVCCIVALFIFFGPLEELTKFSIHSQFYSHIWLIPFVSLYFFFTERKKIFSDGALSSGLSRTGRGVLADYSWKAGVPLIIAGAVLFLIGRKMQWQLNKNDYSSLMTFAAFVFFNGSFLLCYGNRAFKAALFPLFFLIFMVPVPSFIMDRIIHVLLIGSGMATELLFTLTGTAYIREGFTFHLPGLSIEIADVCSGIRSSIALFITMVIAAHMFLKTNWKKIVLLLAIYPITVLKNGVRIVVISLMSIHVDEQFITNSWLHHSGGFVFFIPSLILLGLILWILIKTEAQGTRIEEKKAGFRG
ncbi:MAG: archaeosortase/exosortase family protein [Deltaproteobacteria bacterium]|nr:archaeosortase/exosortase family protein [Deltaproteobacteria bacterium]